MSESTAWPKTLLDKLGPDKLTVIKHIKQATTLDAVAAIVARYELTYEEFNIVAAKMGTTIVDHVSVAQQRREARVANVSKSQFYAAAWRSGAAYRQVARIMGVSHQTVYTLASRVLGIKPMRSTSPITDEQMFALRREWERNPNRDTYEFQAAFQEILNHWEQQNETQVECQEAGQ